MDRAMFPEFPFGVLESPEQELAAKGEAVVVACGVSLISCTLMLAHLWRVRKRGLRLYRLELVALSCCDWLSSVGFMVDAIWCLAGSPPVAACSRLVLFRMFCQISSCLLETHIAVGFAAACFGNLRASKALLYSMPLCFAGGMIFAAAETHFVRSRASEDFLCFAGGAMSWSVVVLSCCALTVCFYLISVCRIRPEVSFQGWWLLKRGASYLLNFTVTLFPIAVINFRVPEAQMQKYPRLLTALCCLLALKGAANVVTYWYWLRRMAESQARVMSGVVGTALDDSRATVSALESHILYNGVALNFPTVLSRRECNALDELRSTLSASDMSPAMVPPSVHSNISTFCASVSGFGNNTRMNSTCLSQDTDSEDASSSASSIERKSVALKS